MAADEGLAKPNWFPDPLNKAEQRYWDGASWTTWVLVDGVVTSEISAPERKVRIEPVLRLPDGAERDRTPEPTLEVTFVRRDATADQKVAFDKQLQGIDGDWKPARQPMTRLKNILVALFATPWTWLRRSKANAIAAGSAALVLLALGLSNSPGRVVPQFADTGANADAESSAVVVAGVTETSSPSSTTTSAANPMVTVSAAIAVEELNALTVAEMSTDVEYNRDDYQPGGWADVDNNCQSTRHEVLIAESLVEPTYTLDGCFVVTGLWRDPWTGDEVTNAGEATIDHMVPLAHAHQAGAWQWDRATKERFTNDDEPAALAVVTQASNSAKGSSSPDQWRPPRREAWCRYAIDWIRVKDRWGLPVSQAEHDTLIEMLATCSDADTDGPAEHAAHSNEVASAAVATTLVAPGELLFGPAAPAQPRGPECLASYPDVCIAAGPDLDCRDIPFRYFTALAPDPHNFDGDDNQVGCEIE